MEFTIPTGESHIDNLIAELTSLIHLHGLQSFEVEDFIKINKDVTFVDRRSKMMHTFNELACGLAMIINGINIENEPDAADWWKK